MQWLDGGFQKLQLDIVGFLAILGESSVLANAQASALSLFFLLPRLLPAPQALIRTARPERLVPSTGKVVGAKSGGIRDNVNYIAHLLHNGNSLPAYSVRCERITHDVTKPSVKARTWGPLTFLSLLGFAMSVALLVFSIIEQDGMALLATILLSLLATLVGIGNLWSLKLGERGATRRVPISDVVITYPNGAFLIVKCDEDIARKLYWHPEECVYQVGPTAYRILSLIATLMLMFGVIFLANARLKLQISFAAAYLILNAAYWTVAALPQRWNWDLSCFHVELLNYSAGEQCDNFTNALWKAIAITRSVEWVTIAKIAPVNGAWRLWLEKAVEVAMGEDLNMRDINGRIILPAWDPGAALTEFLDPNQAEKNV